MYPELQILFLRMRTVWNSHKYVGVFVRRQQNKMQNLIKNYREWMKNSEIRLYSTGGGVKGVINSASGWSFQVIGGFKVMNVTTSVIKSMLQKNIRAGDGKGIFQSFLLMYSLVLESLEADTIGQAEKSWVTNFLNRAVIAVVEDIGLADVGALIELDGEIKKLREVILKKGKLEETIGVFNRISLVLNRDTIRRSRGISFLRAVYWSNAPETILGFMEENSEEWIKMGQLLGFDRSMKPLDGFKKYYKLGLDSCFYYYLKAVNEKKTCKSDARDILKFVEEKVTDKGIVVSLNEKTKTIKNKDGWIFGALLIQFGLKGCPKYDVHVLEDENDLLFTGDFSEISLRKEIFDMHVKGYEGIRDGSNTYFGEFSSKVSNEDTEVVNPLYKPVYLKMKVENDKPIDKKRKVRESDVTGKNKKIK